MPDERPDDPAPGGWLPPNGDGEPITPSGGGSSAPAGWLPPTDADYTPPPPDPHARPTAPAAWQGAAPAVAVRDNLGKATASLALAIVGLFLCPVVFSVAAIVVGTQARTQIDAAPDRYANRGHAQWGVNLGWIGLVLGLILIALVIAGVEITPS